MHLSALLAMQNALIARADVSDCLSSTFRCFVETNKDTIVRFLTSGGKIILVSGSVKFICIFAGDDNPQQRR